MRTVVLGFVFARLAWIGTSQHAGLGEVMRKAFMQPGPLSRPLARPSVSVSGTPEVALPIRSLPVASMPATRDVVSKVEQEIAKYAMQVQPQSQVENTGGNTIQKELRSWDGFIFGGLGVALGASMAALVLGKRRVPVPVMSGVPKAGAELQDKSAPQIRPVKTFEDVIIPAPAAGPPAQAVTVVDLMPCIAKALEVSGLRDGTVTVISRHTTTAITINEWESRLARDLKRWLLQLAPPDDRSYIGTARAGVSYLHNDINKRPESEDERQRCIENGWDVDDPVTLQAWRDQEPINAHSHLASMLLGSSETIPVVDGQLILGKWQSVMLVDVDGPRERKVGVQCFGFQ